MHEGLLLQVGLSQYRHGGRCWLVLFGVMVVACWEDVFREDGNDDWAGWDGNLLDDDCFLVT